MLDISKQIPYILPYSSDVKEGVEKNILLNPIQCS